MSEIRDASIGDIAGINRVSSNLDYEASSRDESRKRLEDILTSDCDFVWVYLENNKIVGWLHLFMALRLASPKFAEIGGLVVDISYRRSGIGRKLVEKAMQWSKQNKLPLRVRCNSNRDEANKFYESLGFTNKKSQKVYELSSS